MVVLSVKGFLVTEWILLNRVIRIKDLGFLRIRIQLRSFDGTNLYRRRTVFYDLRKAHS